jgi:hypothetical protein
MSTIQISNRLDNIGLDCSTSQADLIWSIQRNPLPGGAQPRFLRIDNISNSNGVFVKIAQDAGTMEIPVDRTSGNCFYIAPNSSITVEIITIGGNIESSAFNDGYGNCQISGITISGTATIIITPIGE